MPRNSLPVIAILLATSHYASFESGWPGAGIKGVRLLTILCSNGDSLPWQYIVDAYVKVEGCRLKFIAENQAQLGVAMYSAELPSEHDPELRELVKKLMIHAPCGTFNPNSICMVEGECQKKFPMPYQEETITNVSRYPLYRRRNNGDSVRVGVHEVDCRYVSPPEAFWRLSEYKMYGLSHTVYRLALHLPDQQQVYYKPGEQRQAAARAEGQDTQLTAWFKLNQSDVDARAHLYTDIPEYYVFNNQSNTWTRRQRHRQIVTRMYSASPRNAEKFHLRMLLLHVPGTTSFDDLKTVGGEQLPTFKDACIQLQLLEDDNELEMALKNIALHHINMILNENGMNCAMLGLPEPISEPPAIQHMEEIQEVNPEVINIEQRYIFNSVINALSEIDRGLQTNHRLFYLDAPGGSGKTFLFNMIHDYLVAQNVAVSTSAWIGIAATLLKNGKTLHSIFKLPVPLTETITCNIPPNSDQANILRQVKVFIIDEASMIPRYALNAIDNLEKAFDEVFHKSHMEAREYGSVYWNRRETS
ncbi:uncharacterized protein LOC143040562 [Oratosquilla oratoria]|uniref:uncharacterized protein LOC143040562 n=1 Tax=Oratosquilla oratoria TaxID=337810 RepID=UPI003F764CE6